VAVAAAAAVAVAAAAAVAVAVAARVGAWVGFDWLQLQMPHACVLEAGHRGSAPARCASGCVSNL
jgi:hypothetical protein